MNAIPSDVGFIRNSAFFGNNWVSKIRIHLPGLTHSHMSLLILENPIILILQFQGIMISVVCFFDLALSYVPYYRLHNYLSYLSI